MFMKYTDKTSISLDEFSVKITKIHENPKNENILASATVTFKGSSGHMTITGFTVWKSKFGGFNVTGPTNRMYKQLLMEGHLKTLVDEKVLKAYEYATIPTV